MLIPSTTAEYPLAAKTYLGKALSAQGNHRWRGLFYSYAEDDERCSQISRATCTDPPSYVPLGL